VFGRESRKLEERRAMNKRRLQQGRRLSGSNRRAKEAEDYADENKLDLTGGTLTGPVNVPGQDNINVPDGGVGNTPHGLPQAPTFWQAQATYDGGDTWWPIHDQVHGWILGADDTNFIAENGSGDNAIVRFRILG
jgi:hypothetical protein